MSIEKVVDVVIDLQTATIARAGFGRLLILGPNDNFPELIRIYSSPEGVADDFATTDEEYKAALSVFDQSPRPTDIAIGKRATPVAQVDDVEITALAAGPYTLTLNGTEFTYEFPQVDIITGVTDGSYVIIDVIINSTTIPWEISSSPNMALEYEELLGLINASVEPVTASYINPGDHSAGLYITEDLGTGAFTLSLVGATSTLAAANVVAHGSAPDNTSSVASGLQTFINASSIPVTASLTGTAPDEDLQLMADNAGEEFTTIIITTNMSLTNTIPSVGVQSDLQAIYNSGLIGKSWYGLLMISRIEYEVTEATKWVQANKKIFGTTTNDSDVKGSATDDIASQLKAAGYDRVFPVYLSDATQYPEAAWFGRMFPKQPGSANWAHKTLTGITADELSDTEETNLRNKNCNYYVDRGAGGRTHWGYTSEGEWIDVIVGIDWIEARMQEEVYFTKISVDKIPFTNKGIGQLATPIEAVLIEAVERGILESYEINLPNASDFTAIEKQSRILTGITFSGVLAGAVNETKIRGTVSVAA